RTFSDAGIRHGAAGKDESVADGGGIWDSGFGICRDWGFARRILNRESQIPNPKSLALLLSDDSDLDVRCDLAMQLDRDVGLADLLDRLGELELAPLDLEALGGERLGDVGRRHRSVERLGLAHLAGDDDLDGGQPLGDRLGDALFVGFPGVELRALALDLF